MHHIYRSATINAPNSQNYSNSSVVDVDGLFEDCSLLMSRGWEYQRGAGICLHMLRGGGGCEIVDKGRYQIMSRGMVAIIVIMCIQVRSLYIVLQF